MIPVRKLLLRVAATVVLVVGTVAATSVCFADEKAADAVEVFVPLLPETIPGAESPQTAVIAVCGKCAERFDCRTAPRCGYVFFGKTA